jgi:hypothetical protein
MNDIGGDIETLLRYLNDERLRTGKVEYLHLNHGLSFSYTDHTYQNYLCQKLRELDLANYKVDRGHYLVMITQKSIDIMNKYGSLRSYLDESRRLDAINSSIPATKPRQLISDILKAISAIILKFFIRYKKLVGSLILAIVSGSIIIYISHEFEYKYYIPEYDKKKLLMEDSAKSPRKKVAKEHPNKKSKKNDTLESKILPKSSIKK